MGKIFVMPYLEGASASAQPVHLKHAVNLPLGDEPTIESSPPRNDDRQPTHPGAILREDVLPAFDLTVSSAETLGVRARCFTVSCRSELP